MFHMKFMFHTCARFPGIVYAWRRLMPTGAAAVLAAILAWPSVAAESDDRRLSDSNVYLGGATVRTDGPVNGDLIAAAGRINVNHAVSGDAVLAAGSIEVYGNIGDDLRAAGGVVSVSGSVAGEAMLAGGSIALGPDAEVSGRARLVGSDVVVGGKMRNGLKVYANKILVLGEVNGPVQLAGEQIEILGSARILGDITYSSGQIIKIDSGAKIAGKVTRNSDVFEFPRPRLDMPALPALRPLLLLGLLAAGLLLIAMFPRFTRATLLAFGGAPLKSLGLGTAVFFSLPPVILLLVITIIGIPIALALSAIYFMALLVGYLIIAFFIGDRLLGILRKKSEPGMGWRASSLAASLLLLWLIHNLPYIGNLAIFVLLLAGLGAMILQAFSNYSGRA
jgi:cytoskeletal protein CcmA (bactofilin family)